MNDRSAGPCLLEARDVSKDYYEGRTCTRALRGASLDVREGEILAVMGPSGAGKSTLLHVFGILDRPTRGTVFYRGRETSRLSGAERARIRNRDFGFVFQFFHLLPDLTVTENVLLPAMVHYATGPWLRRRRQERERARAVLERIGLGPRAHARVTRLSGGEKQRVAIARALVGQPQVVFCDEPTGNLDTQTSEEIYDLILELNRTTGQTFVIVTHEASLAQKAHRVARMVDGTIEKISGQAENAHGTEGLH